MKGQVYLCFHLKQYRKMIREFILGIVPHISEETILVYELYRIGVEILIDCFTLDTCSLYGFLVGLQWIGVLVDCQYR